MNLTFGSCLFKNYLTDGCRKSVCLTYRVVVGTLRQLLELKESKICVITLMLKLLCGCLERLGNPNLNIKINRSLFSQEKKKEYNISIAAVYCNFLLLVDTVFQMPDLFLIST